MSTRLRIPLLALSLAMSSTAFAAITPGGGTVPEPGSLALAGLALFAAGWARKTQRRA